MLVQHLNVNLIFLISALIGLGLMWWRGKPRLSVIVPATIFSLDILVQEFFMPPKGGGASFWPIALLVVAMAAAFGGFTGSAIITAVRKRK
jgi:glucose dehydrogenase